MNEGDGLLPEEMQEMSSAPPPTRISLAANWFSEVIIAGVDAGVPGLYEWRIDGVGIYIGRYRHASRPRREYGRNVIRLLNDMPYRRNKPDRYRAIHRALAAAVRNGRAISMSLIENVADEEMRNRREREVIALRREEALCGGLPVLNGN